MGLIRMKSASSLFGLCLVVIMNGLLLSRVEGKVHYHDFIVKEKNFTRLCGTKSMLVVNEQFPGPTLYVSKGDTMLVNVQNQGNSGVTIHWHGVKQPRNPWSDGPEYITQCPIEPGNNFTYEVIFSTEEGTLWWHAHNEWTRNTVHGAIVIYPAEGTLAPYPTPFGEQLLILGSWYDYDVNLVVEQDLNTGVEMPKSSSYLMNGQPGDFCPCSRESTFRWSLQYNESYLLRIVNAAMNAEMFLAIGGHNLTVVGMDGDYLKPFVTSYIMITPGQTMDVLITTNQSSFLGQYYMVARQFLSTHVTGLPFDLTNTTAILEYTNKDSDSTIEDDDQVGIIFPKTLPPYNDSVAAYDFIGHFRSLANEGHPVNVPNNITTQMFITISMNILPYYDSGNYSTGIGSSLNNISWSNTEIDILQAYYRNITGIFTDDFPDETPTYFDFTSDDMGITNAKAVRATKVKMLNFNEQVEIVYQGTNMLFAPEDHPMHLHGHSFYRVGYGLGNFDPTTDPGRYNLIDPPFINTFTVPRNGWIALRFKANNPGVWLWHCHFDKHLSLGMNTVFITKDGDTPESTMRDPPLDMPSCQSSSSVTTTASLAHFLKKSE